MNKLIIILYDYNNDPRTLSYKQVLDEMSLNTPVIYTLCLSFFEFRTLISEGYDVMVLKENGDYILLSELLLNDGSYTNREIKEGHNVNKLLLTNSFEFKSKN